MGTSLMVRLTGILKRARYCSDIFSKCEMTSVLHDHPSETPNTTETCQVRPCRLSGSMGQGLAFM